jgi:hypothetical protein
MRSNWDLARGPLMTNLIGLMVCLSGHLEAVLAETDPDTVDVTTFDGDALVAWVDARAAEYAVTDDDRG